MSADLFGELGVHDSIPLSLDLVERQFLRFVTMREDKPSFNGMHSVVW